EHGARHPLAHRRTLRPPRDLAGHAADHRPFHRGVRSRRDRARAAGGGLRSLGDRQRPRLARDLRRRLGLGPAARHRESMRAPASMSDGEGAGEVSMGSAVEPRPITFMSWLFPFFWLVFLAYPLAAAIRLDGAPRFWGVSLTIAFAVIFYIGMIVGGIGLGTFARTMRNPHAHRTRRALIVVNAALIGMIAIAVVAIPLVGEEALSYLAYISVLAVVSVRRVIPGLVIAASTLIIAEAGIDAAFLAGSGRTSLATAAP